MTTEKKLLITRNPTSIRTKFAIRFLVAMKKVNKKKPPNKLKRFHMIKSAAYGSMASAVGPRRAWSRAVLWKIKNRRRRNSFLIKKRQNPKKDIALASQREYDLLRGLVPGGQGMDFGSLLSETAHYIKCLRAQVEVMNNIAHYYSK